ncbi:type 4a pilus biogenesis protein PilO [Legionella sp. CNM-4043-24]|uniref:type 4a pilus biogenesis protein PilO n=1 Tax=Legionella sp. CNM-4043-24 TaxID=3421646 RepID=UPI00403AFE38
MNNLRLDELTLENVGQWPAVVKYAVAALLMLLIIGMGYWFFTSNNFEQYDALLVDSVNLKNSFEQKQQQAASLQLYENQLKIMEERFGNMLRQLPAQSEMVGLLDDISKTGVSSGLTFVLFAPAPEVTHDFYVEVPISVKVQGTYEQLAVFLSRIAAMKRIVTLHDFEITPVKNEKDKEVSGNLLEMSIIIKIYRYRT